MENVWLQWQMSRYIRDGVNSPVEFLWGKTRQIVEFWWRKIHWICLIWINKTSWFGKTQTIFFIFTIDKIFFEWSFLIVNFSLTILRWFLKTTSKLKVWQLKFFIHPDPWLQNSRSWIISHNLTFNFFVNLNLYIWVCKIEFWQKKMIPY